MFRKSRQIRMFLITTMFTAAAYRSYLLTYPERKCPILTTQHATNHVTKSTLRSLYAFPKLSKNPDGIGKAVDEEVHSIVWHKLPEWVSAKSISTSLQNCQYGNCILSNDTKHLKRHSALIFTLTEGIGQKPPLLPSERPAGQIWVFHYWESPLYLLREHGEVSDYWRSTMNWSMTYRFDSDIVAPYGALTTRQLPINRDYHNIYTRKTKFAAWFVSNCKDDSGRYKFVQDLRKHGVPVDIYGKCGEFGIQSRSNLIDALNNDYKFYFAFENSFCPDYITEKLFFNFNLDVVLVVRGGANYNRLIPKNSFIDTSNFTTTTAFVDYLIKINSSEALYSFYLTEKDKYIYTGVPDEYSYCKLCEMLNHKEKYANVYEDVNEYIYNRDHTCKECSQRTDLNLYLMKWTAFYMILSLICLLLTFILPSHILQIRF